MFKLDDIESIKRAIRVDHNLDDDLILNVYLPAAQRQIKAAISLDEKDYSFFESNSVYNLVVSKLPNCTSFCVGSYKSAKQE